MTFSQLIEQTRIERANVAAQLRILGAALAPLTKIATAPTVRSRLRLRPYSPSHFVTTTNHSPNLPPPS
jgi:hypothetical protein